MTAEDRHNRCRGGKNANHDCPVARWRLGECERGQKRKTDHHATRNNGKPRPLHSGRPVLTGECENNHSEDGGDNRSP